MKKYLIGLGVLMLAVILPNMTLAREQACLFADDISDDISDDCQVEETSSNAGELIKYIKVTAPDILNSPIGRYALDGSAVYTITWDSPTFVKYVNILYTTDNGKTYVEIAADVPNEGSFDWTLPEINQDGVKVRVSGRGAYGNNYGSDLSNSFFSIRNAG